MRGLLAAAFAFALTAAMSVQAADTPKEFPRRGALILLGYDPETPPAECEKRANTAGILRVVLTRHDAPATRVPVYLNVAGFFGVARAICPKDKAPAPLAPFVAGKAKLDPASCLAAKTAMRGGIDKTIDTYVAKEHTDIATGFAAGVAEALAPIAAACDPGDHWAALKTDSEMLTRRVALMKKGRRCSVWRAAGFNELNRAAALAQSHGRAAGRARLERQAITAIAGARHYCDKDGIAEALEKVHYDLTVALIDAAPVTPVKEPPT
jgi:hypothetical protein